MADLHFIIALNLLEWLPYSTLHVKRPTVTRRGCKVDLASSTYYHTSLRTNQTESKQLIRLAYDYRRSMKSPIRRKETPCSLVIQAVAILNCILVATQYSTTTNTIQQVDTLIPLGADIQWSIDSHHGTPIATLVFPAQSIFENNENTRKQQQTISSFIVSAKPNILKHYNASGLVILRGFPFASGGKEAEAIFEHLTDYNRNNGVGPIGFLPGWLQTALDDVMYKTTLPFADGKRKSGLRVLGPASQNVQGPHQEGQLFRWRWPHVGFYVEVAPKSMGETALYDAAAAFQKLPPNLQTKVREYEYYYHLQFNILYDYMPTWIYNHLVTGIGVLLTNNQVTWNPLVLASPASKNQPCLQWFGFGKRIKEQVAAAFNKAYPDRINKAVACHDYDGEYFIRHKTGNSTNENAAVLQKQKGQSGTPKDPQTFTTTEEQVILDAFMASSRLLVWQANDVALVDNIRWAHGRVNGDDSPRVLHFFKSQPMVDTHALAV